MWGSVIRARRQLLLMTQKSLATAVGVTFQQMQKYEQGLNRVASSRLFEIARTLRSPIAYFFDGLSVVDPLSAGRTEREELAREFQGTEEGAEMVGLFPRVRHAGLRRRIVELVRALAEEEEVTVL